MRRHAICTTFVEKDIKQKPTMLNQLLLIGNLGMGELIIILVIILLLFGAKKIPDLMKGLGRGVRSFKEGMNEVKNDIEAPADDKKEEKK